MDRADFCVDNGGQGWSYSIMDNQPHSDGEPPKSNYGNPPVSPPVGEPTLEYAGNGLFYVVSPSGFKYLELFLEAYELYLEKENVRAGNGLDKTGWPDTPNPWDYTYFARGTVSGKIKIGRSKQPKSRMTQLRYENLEKVELLAHLPDGELEWHYLNAFSQHCIKGEWFAPHPDIMAEIEWVIHQSTINPPRLRRDGDD